MYFANSKPNPRGKDLAKYILNCHVFLYFEVFKGFYIMYILFF